MSQPAAATGSNFNRERDIAARIVGLDTRFATHRKAVSKLVHYCTASRWDNRAFLLVDMVGFSTLSSPQQLALRMSLGQAINQCQQRMYSLVERQLLTECRFNRISTGDGFYLWSYDGSLDGHVATFLMMIFLMIEVADLRRHHRVPLRLRAAYGIGEAFVFPYDGPSIPPPQDIARGFRPDAIGPILNQLNRFLVDAVPDQIVVGPFDQPGREYRPGERLNVETMLTMVRSELLPAELEPTDQIKPHDIQLETSPRNVYRVIDKHGIVHHCFNVVGAVPVRQFGKVVYLERIGVLPDEAPELKQGRFREQP